MRLGEMCRAELMPPKGLERIISAIEREQGLTYAAAAAAGRWSWPRPRRVMILLTGGPGTGKTTCRPGGAGPVPEPSGMEPAAPGPHRPRRPSGWARPCGCDAFDHPPAAGDEDGPGTPASWPFPKIEDDPLPADAVIVDETSMVDVSLLARPAGRPAVGTAALCWWGIRTSCPPWGRETSSDHLLRSGAIPSVRPDGDLPAGPESAIVMNAHGVNQGRRCPSLTQQAAGTSSASAAGTPPGRWTPSWSCARPRLPDNMGIPRRPDPGALAPPGRAGGGHRRSSTGPCRPR